MRGLKGRWSLSCQPLTSQGSPCTVPGAAAPSFSQEQQGQGAWRGFKTDEKCLTLNESQSSPFWGYIPRLKWDGIYNCLFSLGWGCILISVFPCPSASPCSLPDPACLSPTGDWRQRVSPNCALWAGVTELPKQRRENFTEVVKFTRSPSTNFQPALDPTSGRWQNTRLRKYPLLRSLNYFCFLIDMSVQKVPGLLVEGTMWWHFHQLCQKSE